MMHGGMFLWLKLLNQIKLQELEKNMRKKLKRNEIIKFFSENIRLGIAPINWSNDDMHEIGGIIS